MSDNFNNLPLSSSSLQNSANGGGGKATPKISSNMYQVEAILGRRKYRGQPVEYLIKWVGYDDPAENSWEPAENCACPELVAQFEERRKKRNSHHRGKEGEEEETPEAEEVGGGEHSQSKKKKQSFVKQEEEMVVDDEENKENENETTTDDVDADVDTSFGEDEEEDEPKIELSIDLEMPYEGKLYGMELGKEFEKVVALKRSPRWGFIALVRYTDDEFELVPIEKLMPDESSPSHPLIMCMLENLKFESDDESEHEDT